MLSFLGINFPVFLRLIFVGYSECSNTLQPQKKDTRQCQSYSKKGYTVKPKGGLWIQNVADWQQNSRIGTAFKLA